MCFILRVSLDETDSMIKHIHKFCWFISTQKMCVSKLYRKQHELHQLSTGMFVEIRNSPWHLNKSFYCLPIPSDLSLLQKSCSHTFILRDHTPLYLIFKISSIWMLTFLLQKHSYCIWLQNDLIKICSDYYTEQNAIKTVIMTR